MSEKISPINELDFEIVDDRLGVKGTPPGWQWRKVDYPSKMVAALRRLTIASINVQAAKGSLDGARDAAKGCDPHLFDSALLAAIVKYGAVFKPDKDGNVIDADQI